MTAPGRVGLLGGTFDPIHAGHLAAADAAQRALDLARVLFIPSHQPPHRPAEPGTSVFHRFAMVSLAVASNTRFLASDVELVIPGRSFTADTLRRLHGQGFAASQLFFIIGTDAFAEIATWHDYPAVLDLAHFVVISRSGDPVDRLAMALPDLAARMTRVREPRDVPGEGQTGVLLVDADTPAVSSTEIRTRLRDGQSIDGMTPERVADHIRRHGLYAAARHGNGDGAQAGRQIA